MKILNLYAGIGGNRKLWGNEHEITAIENVPEIAALYQEQFPDDRVLVEDAHDYLLSHYKEFDFIWSSPPCPTHSKPRKLGVDGGRTAAAYPDMALYQEIVLLQHFAKGKWIVENVIAYYKPLIRPTATLQRHRFWGNFYVPPFGASEKEKSHVDVRVGDTLYGFNLAGTKIKNKRQVLRNLVSPYLAGHILYHAQKNKGINHQFDL